MQNEKWIGKSMTLWGLVITVLSTIGPVLAPFLGVEVSAGEIQEAGASITDALQAVGAAVGSVMVLVGRLRAKTSATLLP